MGLHCLGRCCVCFSANTPEIKPSSRMFNHLQEGFGDYRQNQELEQYSASMQKDKLSTFHVSYSLFTSPSSVLQAESGAGAVLSQHARRQAQAAGGS